MVSVEYKKLGDIATYINGYAFKPEQRGSEGLPIIRIQDLTGNAYDLGYYNGDYPKKVELNDGDVLISWSASLGVYLWNHGKALLNQHIFKVVFDKVEIDKFYFMYAVEYNLDKMSLKTHGATMKHITKKDFDNVVIPYPDLDYQKEVAYRLTSLKGIIEKYQKQLDLLDELVKARFVEMFGDPVINSCQFPVQPMTDICDIIDGDRGKNYPKSEEILDDGYCLFLNAKNVTQKGFDFENCNFITREKDDALRNGKLSRGDVVLTTRGTVGNLAYYSKNVPYENIRINSGMVILRMNRSILNEIYFIELFKMKLSDIKEKIASGSAQPQLPISTMNKIILMIPPLELQNQFASFVQEIDKSRSRIQKSLEASQELFDSLMQEYFG
ncbi:restriction endonuclease subunit S [Catenibacterium sp. RTP21428st1_D7_RTP21428_210409]|uniref:restriction endonuclease subunit S n=1 Tax=Catenibacterium sp. RTP21428st1_D7_RTP21428_210409 TaxID=3153688 RepID=UPI0032EFA8FC